MIAVFLALLVPAKAEAFTKTNLTIRMSDGVDIAATYYTPDGGPPLTGWPAVMLLHGLGQTRAPQSEGVSLSPNSVAERFLVPQGYVALTFDARGHGASGGRVSVDGPREISDVQELFAWLAARGEVNPGRIGGYGYSYGGGALLGAAARGVRFAALEVAFAWTDLYTALLPQSLAKSGVVLGFYQSISGRATPEVDQVLQSALHGTNLPAVRAFARERSSQSALGRISTPTFLLQGRRDFAFDLGHAFTARRLLRGPKRLYISDAGHAPSSNPSAELDYVLPQARMWFDRFLKGFPNGIDSRPGVELAPDPWTGGTFSYRGLPPTRTLRLVYPGQRSIGKRGKVVRTRRLPRARQETFGAPTARVRLSSTSGWNEVVAVLSALTPQGREIVVSAGGARVRLARRPKTIAIRMQSQVTAIPARSRLRLTIGATSTVQSSANLLYLTTNVASSARLTVGRATVTLPVLTRPVSR